MLLIIFSFFTLLYLIFTRYLKIGWEKIPSSVQIVDSGIKVSVVMTVRNESKNIKRLLQDLENQNYEKGKYEVIIFDDHSEDGTGDIIREFSKSTAITIHLMQLSGNNSSPKKQAISNAMKIATGELILITDGDCRVGKNWIKIFTSFYSQNQSRFISGPVAFDRANTLLEKLFNIEFASLIGSGAASIYYKKPIMSNAANMAFTKKVFEEVGGFTGNDNKASGDDVFLMRKIFQKHPDQVDFLKDKRALVYTRPEPNFKSFFHQRVRWAGKWKAVPGVENKLIPLFIFFYHLLMLVTISIYISNFEAIILLIVLILLRYIAEQRFIKSVMRLMNKNIDNKYYLIASLFYPFYAVLMAISTLRSTYEWKGKLYKV